MANYEQVMKTVKEQEDEQRLRDKIQGIEIMLSILNSGIARHKRSGDPVLRTTMLVDKLCTVVDVGLGYLNTQHNDIPPELKEKMTAASQMITEELNFMLDWITNPVYSPDHPYGNKVMKDANNEFDLKK